MTPKVKILTLVLALLVPYFVVFIYFAAIRPGQSHQPPPDWLPYFGMAFMLFFMIFAPFASRRIFRHARQGSPVREQPAPPSFRGGVVALLLVWSGLFFYGAYGTIMGKFPVRRAIPAGAFLLAFIGLFSWQLYRDNQLRKISPDSQPPDSADLQ